MQIETRVRRALVRAATVNNTITVDDGDAAMERLGLRPNRFIINRVLRGSFRPVGYRKTDKPSRHGRPVRSWKLA